MKIPYKKLIIGSIALCVAAILILNIFVGTKQYSFNKSEFEGFFDSVATVKSPISLSFAEEGYTEIAITERLKLEYDKTNDFIKVTDLLNGKVWSSDFDLEKLESVPKNKQLRAGLQAAIGISYADSNGLTNVINSKANNVNCEAKGIENGLELTYSFTKQKITVRFYIWLDGETVVVHFPKDAIEEKGDYLLMTIDVLPMFMAATDDEDGYIVFPEGSGALYNWNKSSASQTKIVSKDIWSDRNVDIDKMAEQTNSGEKGILVPAFGIKSNDTAVVSYVESGAECCSVTLATSEYVYAANRVYASLINRKTVTYMGANNTEYTAVEKNTQLQDTTIRFGFIADGEKANYSGMAACVREMMKNDGTLVNDKKEPYRMKMDMLMGAIEETVLYSKYISSTTFSQASEMLDYLKKGKVSGLAIEMLGWQSGGFGRYPSSAEFSNSIGTESELKSLNKAASDLKSDIYLSMNLLNASSENGGFSTRSDVIFDSIDLPITNEKQENYLLNPYVSYKKTNSDLMDILGDTGITGVSYEGIGRFLYEDYNSKNTVTRRDTVAVQRATLKKSSDVLGKAMSQHGNSYILAYSDFVTDVPAGTGTSELLQEEIPFYQLIVHGSVPYTLETVGNLTYDLEEIKLRWLEYGALPYFVMSYNGSEILTNTEARIIYSSSFEQWKDTVIEIYNEFQPITEEISAQQMISHNQLADGVYRTVYENGRAVIVNYNETQFVYGETTIEGNSYYFE